MAKKIAKKIASAPIKKGILSLADMLVNNMKGYDQDTYANTSSCGTVGCLAGFCYAEQIGVRTYNKLAKNEEVRGDLCVEAGNKKLGLTGDDPAVFGSIDLWPTDLRQEYFDAAEYPTKKARSRGKVVVALKALSRLKKNGSIAGPGTLITDIPQLNKLLKEDK